ncbi:MAG: NAD(P)-dependent oxidoreductase [Pseudomonadota bacterium]
MTLKGKTLFITGGSRGIGLEIAKRAAQDGANVAIAAKTAEPHPKLPGTIYTAAEEIEAAGGQALPIVCDIRDEDQVIDAMNATVEKFGGVDALINNASAISLTGTQATDMKRYDLMNSVNARGTYLVSRIALPHLKASDNPHILTLSPPLDMDPKWFARHVAYTIAKMGMSMCTLGMAAEFKKEGVAVNSLWPLTAIDTMAIRNVIGNDQMAKMCRLPSIMADAAHAVLTQPSRDCTGNFFIDETVLRDAGVTDFDQYAVDPGGSLFRDFFVPDDVAEAMQTKTMTAY